MLFHLTATGMDGLSCLALARALSNLVALRYMNLPVKDQVSLSTVVPRDIISKEDGRKKKVLF